MKSKSAPASHKKHDTAVKSGTLGPKDVIKIAAKKAHEEGKDPEKAAKLALSKITHEAAKAGIKPGPKNVV